jgi:hypothetical protein
MKTKQKAIGGGNFPAVSPSGATAPQEEEYESPFPTNEEIEELIRRIVKRRKKFQKAAEVILKFPSLEEGFFDFYDGYALRNFFKKIRRRYVGFANANGGEIELEQMFEAYEEDGIESEFNYPEDWN